VFEVKSGASEVNW